MMQICIENCNNQETAITKNCNKQELICHWKFSVLFLNIQSMTNLSTI